MNVLGLPLAIPRPTALEAMKTDPIRSEMTEDGLWRIMRTIGTALNSIVRTTAVPNFHNMKCRFKKGMDSIRLVVPALRSRVGRSATIIAMATNRAGKTLCCSPAIPENIPAIKNPITTNTVSGYN